MTPYTTKAGVKIGARYVEPTRPPEMGRDAERLQRALICDPDRSIVMPACIACAVALILMALGGWL
jgi:hypothetical protein